MNGYVHPPEDDVLPAFPDADKVRPKTRFPGGKRRRWRDSNHIYEWDYRHGHVEKYDLRGRHLGAYDHKTGEQVEDAVPSRRVDP